MNAPTPGQLARVPIRVRWRDLDAYNHVNNSTFLTYLEEARLAWLSGIDGEWINAGSGPVLAASQINFLAQIEWPADIVVEIDCAKIGNSSLTLGHRITSADGSKLHSDGSVVMVWVNPTDGRPVSLPTAVRAACE